MNTKKNNRNNIELNNDINEDVVEAYQTDRQLLSMAFGIVSCAICISLIVKFLPFLSESIWYWFLICIFGYLIVRVGFELYLRLFKSPRYMSIRNNVVSISVLFHERIILDATEIDQLQSNGVLSVFIPSSGWLISTSRDLRLVIAKPFFENFDPFVAELSRQNPKCTINEKLLEWKGPRSSDS